MARYNRQPILDEQPEFPYDPAMKDKLLAAGDEKTKEGVFFGMEWLRECNSGLYHSWEDLKFLRDNWEGPLVVKGIQSVLVSRVGEQEMFGAHPLMSSGRRDGPGTRS